MFLFLQFNPELASTELQKLCSGRREESWLSSSNKQHCKRGAKSRIRWRDSSLRRPAALSPRQPASGIFTSKLTPYSTIQRYSYKEWASSALNLLKSQVSRPIHLESHIFFPFLVGGHTWKVPTLDNEKWGMYLQWRVTHPVLTMRKANRRSRYAACVNLYTESGDEKYTCQLV
jgi:hypothetical protein